MMKTDIRLKETYAQTLFALAGENQTTDAVKEDLEIISDIIKHEKEFIEFLRSPYFSSRCKEQFVEKTLSGRISELTMNFLMVLIRHNRSSLLPEIIASFGQLWDAHRGYYPIKVTVSHPLGTDEVKELTAGIEAAIGGTARLELAVNPAIIGGTIIRCSDKVIDNTVRSRLQHAVKTIIGQVKSSSSRRSAEP
jgi:F-type H+-transporting ATPase subunit delta